MDTAWRFRVAAHELAENITKYSSGADATLQIGLEEVNGEHAMHVFARNEATPERLEQAARWLAEIKETANPVALYDRIARENAPRGDVSGLGLARIRAEGGLDLEYTIEGSELTISVHSRVQIRSDS